ncbi:MAG: hypothetical protein A3F33_00940 [Candidatus Woykebacteria bacterium RIFCSPHIGHO2_12_FULL_43_10]|uniref:Four helix bundle protein n=1 Tax=Candidatus Woykebacteria bacterium RIFCSPLOWO2_01_FULL_43_14 TaxID=1802605 RepID=A0A1G1WYJ9_9BACT|nr:MAG: hypothetical protein A3F33_00940 [Candidatus Woykebacteria bacterium RIFCSPHIGHO2_12_FULL_43_10]OGY32641.1 MAG: hypothetical protein A3A61_04080 [Candidatus Woykebacteria bacterium RIFCSPLOWO2_01_FULL_43_14]
MLENRFENLKVWEKAHEMTLKVYLVSSKFPNEERFGLVQQLRRAASSVPANIVEGNARRNIGEYLQFLNIAFASLQETKYHLYLSRDLGYINQEEYQGLIRIADEVGKMCTVLIRNLKSKV